MADNNIKSDYIGKGWMDKTNVVLFDTSKEGQEEEPKDIPEEKPSVEENSEYEMIYQNSIWNWFCTFMITDIPIIGEVVLLIWALSSTGLRGRRQYAIARLLYKLIFDAIAAVSLSIMWVIGTGLLEQLLAYMEQL